LDISREELPKKGRERERKEEERHGGSVGHGRIVKGGEREETNKRNGEKEKKEMGK